MSQKPMITVNGFYKEVTEGFITLGGSHKKIIEAYATIDGKYKKVWTTTQSVQVPKQSNILTYNGKSQNPEWTYDKTAMTIVAESSTQSATDGGNYDVVFSLNEGYVWSDTGTDEDRSFTWTINPAVLKLSVPDSYTFESSNEATSANITVSNVGGRTLTVTTYNDMISASVSNGTITINRTTNQVSGEYLVTVKAKANKNYEASSVDITVYSNAYTEPLTPQTLQLSRDDTDYSTEDINLDFGTSKKAKVIYYRGCYTTIGCNKWPADNIFEYTYTKPDKNGEGSITIKRNTNNAVNGTGWYFFATSDEEYAASNIIAVNVTCKQYTGEEQSIQVFVDGQENKSISFTADDNPDDNYPQYDINVTGAKTSVTYRLDNISADDIEVKQGEFNHENPSNQSFIVTRSNKDAFSGSIIWFAEASTEFAKSKEVPIEVEAEAYVEPEEPSIEYILVLPTQAESLTYNTSEQSPTWNNYDRDKMTIGGITKATDAGTHKATFTPMSQYGWADTRTTEKRTAEWIINRKSNKISVSPTSHNFSSKENLDSFIDVSVSNSKGTVSVSGGNNSTASYDSENHRIVRKTQNPFNSVKFVFTDDGGGNYTSSSDTCIVSADAYVTKRDQEIKPDTYSIDFAKTMGSKTIYLQGVIGNLSATVNSTDNLSVEVDDVANTVTIERTDIQAITNATVSIVASATEDYEQSNTVNIRVDADEILAVDRPQTPIYIDYTGSNVIPTIQLPDNVIFVTLSGVEAWVNAGHYSTGVRPSDGYYWKDSVEANQPDASAMTIDVYIQPIPLKAPELRVIQGNTDLGTDVTSETLVQIINNNSIEDVTVNLNFTTGDCLFCSVSNLILSVKRIHTYTKSFTEKVGVQFETSNSNYSSSEFTYITFTGDQLAELPTEELKLPRANAVLLYNARSQSPTWINYDYDDPKMTIEGITEATNAGTYTATFTPITTETTKYVWEKIGTQEPRDVEWRIAPQDFADSVQLQHNGKTCSQINDNKFYSDAPAIIISIGTPLSTDDKVNVSFEGFNVLSQEADLVYVLELSGDTGSVTVSTESTNFDHRTAVYNFIK